FFFSSRRRHTRFSRDWSSDVCSSDLAAALSGRAVGRAAAARRAGARADARSAGAAARRAAGRARSRHPPRTAGADARAVRDAGQDRGAGDPRRRRGRLAGRHAGAAARRPHRAAGQRTRAGRVARRSVRGAVHDRATQPGRGAVRTWLLPLLLLAGVASAQESMREPSPQASAVIGSKNFTESVILGDIGAALGPAAGTQVEHRRQLGGTRILWRALLEGEIDAYPEYTGTLAQELLQMPGADIHALREALAGRGLTMTDPLGVDNSYALGMAEARAQALGIDGIDDLRAHPDLRLGFSNEFMQRADGWPGLRAAYRLPQRANGLDHDLAYRALANGALDVTDLYRTDAEIPYYGLRVLDDSRHYFPSYEAVYLYRSDLARRAPRWLAALQGLAGRIDAETMQGLNARVKLDREPAMRVAADWLGVDAPEGRGRAQRIWRRTVEHLALVGISLGLALLVALPLGIVAARRPRL